MLIRKQAFLLGAAIGNRGFTAIDFGLKPEPRLAFLRQGILKKVVGRFLGRGIAGKDLTFLNLTPRGVLVFSAAERREERRWGGQRDSNPQQQAPQAWTLPLSYDHQPGAKLIFPAPHVKRRVGLAGAAGKVRQKAKFGATLESLLYGWSFFRTLRTWRRLNPAICSIIFRRRNFNI